MWKCRNTRNYRYPCRLLRVRAISASPKSISNASCPNSYVKHKFYQTTIVILVKKQTMTSTTSSFWSSYMDSQFGTSSSNSRHSSPSLATLLNFSHIPTAIQYHLRHVYTTITILFAITSISAYTYVKGILSLGNSPFLLSLLTLGTLIWFSTIPPTPSNNTTRQNILFLFAALQGQTLGPIIEYAGLFPLKSVLIPALSSTAILFASFSLTALYAKSRSLLYLGGILTSALSIMFWMSFISIFLPASSTLYQTELYLGLFVFAGFVVYDTQLIVYKAEKGSRDYLGHALELFMDLVAIFVRVLVILLRKAQKEEEEKRKNQKRR